MKILMYRFTHPEDGAEHGGICRSLRHAETIAKETTGVHGIAWVHKIQFKYKTIKFEPKVNGILASLYEAMEFAHDVHELVPMVRSTNGKSSPNDLKRGGAGL